MSAKSISLNLLLGSVLCCLLQPATAVSEIVADSVADWSTSGTQGENGWSYGFFNATGHSNYDATDFQAFEGPTWLWDGNRWDEANVDGDNLPWTFIAQGNGHPNGSNNADLHYAIRRWEADVAGLATIDYSISKANLNCGNGTTAILFHNGVELSQQTVSFDDAVGVAKSAIVSVDVGDQIDLALSPLGTDGTLNGSCDSSRFSMTVDIVPEPTAISLLATALLFAASFRRRRAT